MERNKVFNIHNQILTKLIVHSGIFQKLIQMIVSNDKSNKKLIAGKIVII